MSLKTKMALAITALVVLLVGLGSAVQLHLAQAQLKQTVADQQFSLVSRVAEEIDQRIQLNQASLARTAAAITPAMLGQPEKLQAFLNDKYSLLLLFDDLIVVGRDGRVIADSPVMPERRGTDVSAFPHIREALEEGRAVVSRPFFGRITRLPTLAMTAPVLDGEGRVIASLSGTLQILKPQFLGGLAGRKVGRSGHFVLVTRDRTTLVSRFPERVLQPNAAPGQNPVFDRAIAGFEGSDEGATSYGQRVLMSFKAVPSTDWVLGALLPVEEAYAPIETGRWGTVYYLLLTALAVAVLAWLAMRRVLAPLSRLRQHVVEVRQDHARKLADPVLGQDEIGGLAREFYLLLDELGQARDDLGSRIAEMESIFDASPVVIGVVRDRCLIQANRAFERLFGVSLETALGQTVVGYYPTPEEFAEFGQQLYPAVADGRVAHFLRRFRRADGSLFWANFYARQIDAQQPQRGIIIVIEDVDQARHQEEVLRESEERYRQMFENNTSVKLLIDAGDGAIVDANPAAADFYGYPLETLRRMNIAQLNQLSVEEVRAEMALADQQQRRYFNFRHRLANGELREVEVHSGPVLLRGRRLLYSIIHDITARRRAEEQLRLSAKVFEGASEGIVICDRNNRIMSVNRAFVEITGYAEAEVQGRDPRVLNSGRHDAAFFANLWHHLKTAGTWQGEIWNRRKGGEVYPEWLSITTVRDEAGEVSNYVAVFADVSERKRNEEHIRFLAEHDYLTGLPNRSLLHDRLQQAIALAERNDESLALMFIDLDRFKNINDSLGHQVGDQLLQEVGRRIQACVRSADTVSRPGGDEFIILLPSIETPQDAARVAEKLLESLNRPYQLGGHELVITASIGIAVFPEDGRDFQTLVKNADAAMYYSKEAGRDSFHFFTPDMNARVFERLSLENSLRRALERQEFLLYYQPQVDMPSGRVIGFEALIRWQHPQMGLVSPARFIPVAEDSGLIVPIGEWVLGEACRQNRAWQEQGMPAVPVAVNISALQFRQPQFEASVERALAESGLEPAWLELELTESMMLHQGQGATDLLDRLKARGVRLSIDDFGTGYSSLAYLKRLPLDKLKIDQAFVRDIASDAGDAAITATIIQMAHNLGLSVIAEGVETEAQLEFLQAHDCASAQGFYFARPMPAADIRAFWDGRR